MWQKIETFMDRLFPAFACILTGFGVLLQFAPKPEQPGWVTILALLATIWWCVYGVRIMFKGIK